MPSKNIKSFSINYFTQDQSSFFIHTLNSLNRDYPLTYQRFRVSFYTILVLNRGTYHICINENDYSNVEDSIYVLKPGDIVCMRIGVDCEGTFVGFEDSFFSQRYHENVLRFFDFFRLDAISQQCFTGVVMIKINVLVELMVSEFYSGRMYKLKVLRSFLNILLCELQYSVRISEGIAVDLSKPVVNERVLAFLELIEMHFKDAKTPSFYADKLFVTPNYLNKLCKQERGITAGQMVRQRIVIEAKRLLQFSTYNINEIARELCFDNTSYFVTFFKKHEGITPESYRKTFV